MFSLGNWIVLAALGSGGSVPGKAGDWQGATMFCSVNCREDGHSASRYSTPSLFIATTVFCNIQILVCSTWIYMYVLYVYIFV